MLARAQIESGDFIKKLIEESPNQRCWTLDEIEQSLQETLASYPVGEYVWLFGYGALIWNPIFNFLEKQTATLNNWHRSFCMQLLAGRATQSTPGRMLALIPGGHASGVAFRLARKNLDQELRYLWILEMVHGLYKPLLKDICLASGKIVKSLTFVANDRHPYYQIETSIEETASLIVSAQGHLGSNSDYLMLLERALTTNNLHDSYISELANAVRLLT